MARTPRKAIQLAIGSLGKCRDKLKPMTDEFVAIAKGKPMPSSKKKRIALSRSRDRCHAYGAQAYALGSDFQALAAVIRTFRSALDNFG